MGWESGRWGPVGKRGHSPGRADHLHLRDIPASTPTTAQGKIRNTNVNTKQHGLPTGLHARPILCPLVLSRSRTWGARECGQSVPQGSSCIPFLSSSSILHSDWPTITSLFPHLLENHICPLGPSLLAPSLLLQNDRAFPWLGIPPLQFTAPHCPRPAVPWLSAGSVLTSLAMQIYAALLSARHCLPCYANSQCFPSLNSAASRSYSKLPQSLSPSLEGGVKGDRKAPHLGQLLRFLADSRRGRMRHPAAQAKNRPGHL